LSFGVTPVVKRLLIANVAVFFVGFAIGPEFFYDWLGFHPGRVLTRPWGMFTYMFVHGGLMHLLLNMLVLFFFGPPLEGRWGSREFTKYYLLCGLGGAGLSFLFFTPDIPIVGASAAVYGLMLAFAMAWPDSPIYVWGIFPVKAKWLVAFLFVVSLFSAFNEPGGAIAHFAHLGGLAAGFIYLKLDWRPSRKLSELKRAAKVRRLAIVPRDEEEDRTRPAPGRGTWTPGDERRMLDAVDQVLDKISAQGMSSLTHEERRLLDEVSKRHRTN
jgi:membrane associated rhomboid family serine protease